MEANEYEGIKQGLEKMGLKYTFEAKGPKDWHGVLVSIFEENGVDCFKSIAK